MMFYMRGKSEKIDPKSRIRNIASDNSDQGDDVLNAGSDDETGSNENIDAGSGHTGNHF